MAHFQRAVESERGLLWFERSERLYPDTNDITLATETSTARFERVIAALIQPEGQLEMLAGDLPRDPACIAALGHAVQVASAELFLRLHGVEAGAVTLQAATSSITIMPAPSGALLLLEHSPDTPSAKVRAQADELLSSRRIEPRYESPKILSEPTLHHQTALARPPRNRGLVSLSDALNVTEP